MPGLVPGISLRRAQCIPHRDGRDKLGHDDAMCARASTIKEDAMINAKRVHGLLAAACLALIATPAAAQDYPTKAIYTICPFGPGTGADILVRFFAAKLGDVLGKTVVVENKVGAQGNIATEAVAKAKPDGYTIAITPGSSTLAMAAHIFKKLNYDPVRDFTPVAPLSTLSFAMVVDAKKPLHTLTDLTAFLKEKKGRGIYGGGANSGIVTAELYLRAIGAESERVAFRTPTDTLKALQIGDIDFTATDASWTVGQVNEGRVRALAVTSSKRTRALPNVPTMVEQGFADIVVEPWWGVFVPAGTPAPIVDKLHAAFAKILDMQETKDFLFRIANDPLPGPPEMLKTMLARDLAKWGEYVRLARIEPQ
jgi:tripartite-type tricarboxylate transporter receptor subunit TctC